jgi:hypothetical protein
MSLISKLVKKGKEIAVKNFINDVLKDVAEGKWGSAPKGAYWWTHSHALWIGLVLTLVHFTLGWFASNGVCAACAGADHWLVIVAEVLVPAGLATGFHAAEPPAPASTTRG